jgi:hypothetical protein
MPAKKDKLTVTYFPYTFLDENDLKRLIPYFDTIRVLQVFPDSDPGLPELVRTSELVQLYAPISDTALLETLGKAHKTYSQLAKVYQDGGLAHLHQAFSLQEDFEDSRTGLVARIRQAYPRLSEEELELLSHALFILLAHQFDYEHLDLDLQLEGIRGLEAKFQREVGILTDEEGENTEATPVLLQESDPPRTQYPFQRLKTWTNLYCLQEKTTSFPTLTTSQEVLSEIAERLPANFVGPAGELPSRTPAVHLLSILPDTNSLSMEEVLEFRQLLSRESTLANWRESLAAAFDLLKRESLEEERWQEINHHLQEQAQGFFQLWPASEKPSRNLRLECLCYPRMQPEGAFAIASGLKLPAEKIYTPGDTNGITLLIYPSETQPSGRE